MRGLEPPCENSNLNLFQPHSHSNVQSVALSLHQNQIVLTTAKRPACRSRTQTTFRCCSLRGMVVSGEGKAQEKNRGQVTSRERNESEPLPCRREQDDVETAVVRRSWDKAPAGSAFGRSDILKPGDGRMEHENLGVDAKGEATSGLTHEGESTDATLRADCQVVAMKRSNVRGAKRAGHRSRSLKGPTRDRRSPRF